jgi:hypothetical protein
MAEYSLLICKIFYHVDKGPISKHTNYFLLEVFMDENGGSHKPKGLLKIANHIRNNHQNRND